jgi:hypothetical protein
MSLFREDLDRGFAKPVRHHIGDAPNTWASNTHRLAERFDKLDLPEEAAALLHELFEEIGQQTRDSFAAIYQAGQFK